MTATCTRHADTLAFTGALDREAAARLWPQVLAQLAGVRALDLAAVERVDSAGLAMLAEAATRAEVAEVRGRPPGLGELRLAYRLRDDLSFTA